MQSLLALVIGALFAAGLYMIMRRSIIRIALGLVLLSYAANLLIFTAAGLTRGRPPLVPEGALRAPETIADPLPQALILTAIVINFGVLAFALVLIQRTYQLTGTEDVDEVRAPEA